MSAATGLKTTRKHWLAIRLGNCRSLYYSRFMYVCTYQFLASKRETLRVVVAGEKCRKSCGHDYSSVPTSIKNVPAKKFLPMSTA